MPDLLRPRPMTQKSGHKMGRGMLKMDFDFHNHKTAPSGILPLPRQLAVLPAARLTFINNRNMVYLSSDGKNGFSWTR